MSRSRLALAAWLTTLVGASALTAQRIACVGALFTQTRIDDTRQQPAAALRWRLPAGHEVAAYAGLDRSLLEWRPHILVVTEDVCRAGAAVAHTLRALEREGITAQTFVAAPCRRNAEPTDDPLRDARNAAAEIDATLVDLRPALRADTMADATTLNSFGAEAVARLLAQAITGQSPPTTTTPVPSAEHRASAAGWGTGSWWDQHDKIRALAAANRDLALVLLGDSITQSLTGTGNRLTAPDGGRAIDQTFGHLKAAGLGISGDRTQHLLFRLRQGELAALRPRAIVLQIGINNVSAGDSAEAIAAGIEAIIAELRQTQPQARIVSCGPFPAGADAKAPARSVVAAIHAQLRSRPRDPQVTHLDLTPLFVAADGKPTDRLAGDHLHISEAGREAWLAALARELRDLWDTPSESGK